MLFINTKNLNVFLVIYNLIITGFCTHLYFKQNELDKLIVIQNNQLLEQLKLNESQASIISDLLKKQELSNLEAAAISSNINNLETIMASNKIFNYFDLNFIMTSLLFLCTTGVIYLCFKTVNLDIMDALINRNIARGNLNLYDAHEILFNKASTVLGSMNTTQQQHFSNLGLKLNNSAFLLNNKLNNISIQLANLELKVNSLETNFAHHIYSLNSNSNIPNTIGAAISTLSENAGNTGTF
jgi:hypothetical protein